MDTNRVARLEVSPDALVLMLKSTDLHRVAKFPLPEDATIVDVHYDPANPALAVLECRVRGLWALWAVAGAMFIGATVSVGLL